MEILIPTGAGKQAKDSEQLEISMGNRKMDVQWLPNGSFISVDAKPTSTKKKGATVEIGNGYVIVRAFDQGEVSRDYEPAQTFTAGATKDLDKKLAKVVEEALDAVRKYKASLPNVDEQVVTDVNDLF